MKFMRLALGVALSVRPRRGVRGEREETEDTVEKLDNTINWKEHIQRITPERSPWQAYI
jgi:hypothetical protein